MCRHVCIFFSFFFLYLSNYISINLSTFLFNCLFIFLPICLPISIHPCLYFPHLPLFFWICLSLSICLLSFSNTQLSKLLLFSQIYLTSCYLKSRSLYPISHRFIIKIYRFLTRFNFFLLKPFNLYRLYTFVQLSP